MLHRFGGLYADIDMEARQSFDSLTEGHMTFFGVEPDAHSFFLNAQNQTVCNSIMASAKGHPFWSGFMDYIEAEAASRAACTRYSDGTNAPEHGAVALTGPKIMERFLKVYLETADDITVFPDYYFMPEVAPYQREPLKEKCDNRMILNSKTIELCDLLASNEFKGKPEGPETYALHHWTCSYCGKD